MHFEIFTPTIFDILNYAMYGYVNCKDIDNYYLVMRVSPALEDRGCVAAGQTTGGQTQVLIPIITAPTNIKPGAATERRDLSREPGS